MTARPVLWDRTQAAKTPAAWLPFGAQVGAQVRAWAGREGIVAFVGAGAGGEVSPIACYIPALKEVELNVKEAFGELDPSYIGDFTKTETHRDFPKAAGALFHESMHARFTRWSLADAQKELTAFENTCLTLLEESRIEALGLKILPEQHPFIRAVVFDICLTEKEPEPEFAETGEPKPPKKKTAKDVFNTYLNNALLILPRIDAGVFTKEELEVVYTATEIYFGEDILAQMREIWLRFQKHEAHFDATYLYKCAREFAAIIEQSAQEKAKEEKERKARERAEKKAAKEAEKQAAKEAAEEAGKEFNDEDFPEDAEDESEERELTDEEITAILEFLEILKALRAEVEMSVIEEIAEIEAKERAGRLFDQKKEDAKQKDEAKAVASKIFGAGTGPSDRYTSSTLTKTMTPDSPTRAAAVTIARQLEKAKYFERDEKEIRTQIPPGRLHTRSMVQAAAYKAAGSTTVVKPWNKTVRRHVDDPTLTVGVIVDISGSMGAAMIPMANTAWIMSEAVRRVQGKCAMVYYGDSVFATLKPGQHLTDVHVYNAPDGTENFDKGFKAIDGALNLLHGSGARLLVIVSDCMYTPDEVVAARKWIAECEKRGVAVLIMDPRARHGEPGEGTAGVIGKTKTKVVQLSTDTSQVALEIGYAAAQALTAMGARAR